MRVKFLQQFLQLESASGILLFAMALIAVLWANSPLRYYHQKFIELFLFLINEGLMALFFLVVGLELKRGYLDGQLSRFADVILPAIAALGGMLIPALVYCYINYSTPLTLKGWATPVATDIAFALGILSLFGRRVPVGLKLFLLALAIYDDIGAMLIIVFFYSKSLSYFWLLPSGVLMLMLYLLNIINIRLLTPYLLMGGCLWFCLFRTGIHPAIAGVLIALTIPDGISRSGSPLHRLERLLHPWAAYFIMPIFALANAGFSLEMLSWAALTHDVVRGIVFALSIGKPLGVFGFSWLLIRLGVASLPAKSTWLALFGVSLLCGIGFTMSLFLGTLSFENENNYLAEVRLGVFLGSLLSGLAGAIILFITFFVRNRSCFVE